ncbi:membrane protein YoeI [Klebsiella pneumoniae]
MGQFFAYALAFTVKGDNYVAALLNKSNFC